MIATIAEEADAVTFMHKVLRPIICIKLKIV